MHNANIFHIIDRQTWQAAGDQPGYEPHSIISDGFIHASTIKQILRVANAFYAGADDLVLLEIAPSLLTSELRWEDAINPANTPANTTADPALSFDGSIFPHIYGALNTDAVVAIHPLPRNSDGRYMLPDSLL